MNKIQNYVNDKVKQVKNQAKTYAAVGAALLGAANMDAQTSLRHTTTSTGIHLEETLNDVNGTNTIGTDTANPYGLKGPNNLDVGTTNSRGDIIGLLRNGTLVEFGGMIPTTTTLNPITVGGQTINRTPSSMFERTETPTASTNTLNIGLNIKEKTALTDINNDGQIDGRYMSREITNASNLQVGDVLILKTPQLNGSGGTLHAGLPFYLQRNGNGFDHVTTIPNTTETQPILTERSTTFLGVDDITSPELKITLYPNPVTDYLRISSPFEVSERLDHISIVDLQGKVVHNEAIYDNGYALETHGVNLSSLQSGMYIVQVKNKKGQMKAAKIIKK